MQLHRTIHLLFAGAFLLYARTASVAPPAASDAVRKASPVVALQPFKGFDASLIEPVKAAIQAHYPVDIIVLPAAALPDTAYYEPRQRYRAERLLDWLEKGRDAKFDKIVGLTSRDISTTKGDVPDWGIFGLGNLGGPACVVSTLRLQKGSVPRDLLIARLDKVVVHELGHTFGLQHCPNAACVMEDARGSIHTVDNETGELCAQCRALLPEPIRRP